MQGYGTYHDVVPYFKLVVHATKIVRQRKCGLLSYYAVHVYALAPFLQVVPKGEAAEELAVANSLDKQLYGFAFLLSRLDAVVWAAAEAANLTPPATSSTLSYSSASTPSRVTEQVRVSTSVLVCVG